MQLIALIALKRIKYLGINLTKELKDLYMENYRTLKKEIEKVTMSSESIHRVHVLEELSLKCLYYPKQSINSMQFISKYQWHISQI